MKILLINSVYKKGSTGNIVKSLYEGYKEYGHDTFVIYGRGDRTYLKDNHIFNVTSELESKLHHLLSKFTGNMYGGMHISTRKIIKKIKDINPDVIHLHCLNGYFVNIYKLLNYLKTTNKKIVLTMHADFMMTGGCGYSVECDHYLTNGCKHCPRVKEFNGKLSLSRTHHLYKKLYKSIKGFNKDNLIITCVSPWLTSRYRLSPIYKEYRIETVLNPIDDIFFTKLGDNPYKDKDKNILYVTPDIYDQEKSGWLIEEVADKLPNYHFTVIDAKDNDYKVKHNNITYISKGVTKDILRDYYGYAFATLLLSKRETFSMVVAESISLGTPIVGFKNGGSESIAEESLSYFVEYNDIDSLVDIINKLDNSNININNINKYKKEIICKEYIKFYE